MSDPDAPDPIDLAYSEAQALLADDEARAARRARVLAAVAQDEAAPKVRRSTWARGGLLVAACAAGFSLFLATQLNQPLYSPPPAAPQATPEAPSAAMAPIAPAPAPEARAFAEPPKAQAGVTPAQQREEGLSFADAAAPPPPPPVQQRAVAPPIQQREVPPPPVTVPPPPMRPQAPPPVARATPPAPSAFPLSSSAAAPTAPPGAELRGLPLPPPPPPPPSGGRGGAGGASSGALRAPAPPTPTPQAAAPPAAAGRGGGRAGTVMNYNSGDFAAAEAAPPPANDPASRLRTAAIAGRLAEVETLLAQGVAVDATDAQGNTALMLSINNIRPAVVALLRRNGANLDRRNNAGRSARDMALALGNVEINQILGLE